MTACGRMPAMIKLYYSPGSSSMAAHIALEESGVPYTAVRVNHKDKSTADGEDYNAINPKSYVPAVKLEHGEVYTENTALLAWIGKLNPTTGLMPPAGTPANFRVAEWLGYLSTEVHKTISPMFRATTPEDYKVILRELLARRLAYIEQALDGQNYLVGEHFTVADAMLFTITTWFSRLNVDMAPYPNLKALQARVGARPKVIKAMQDEGLKTG
jgi:glutathione S-transferase